MRAKIEKWSLMILLAYGYLIQVPGLWRQGATGIPALAIGAAIFGILILLLFRESDRAAFVVAALASLSALTQVIGYFLFAPHIRGMLRPSPLQLTAGIAGAMIVGYLAIDLWSQWRPQPNTPGEKARPDGCHGSRAP